MTAICTPATLQAGLPDAQAISDAAVILSRYIVPTPQIAWPLLAARSGCTVIVKHENHMPTGAFKVRGGLMYMTRLRETQPCIGGIVTATRGNHGQSVALAARAVGLNCVIVVPEGNSPEKNAAMAAFGAELVVHGHDFQAAADHAATLAMTRGLHFIPSYHRWLIEGVATSGYELLSAHPELEAVFVPVGMGSGICGMLAARAALGHKARIYGVVAEGAPAYRLSFCEGQIVKTERAETIADGLACRSPNDRALDAILEGATDVLMVSDDEIVAAMRAYFVDTHNLAEGAAAAPLAALLQVKDEWQGRPVGVVLSGGNVDAGFMARVLAETN